MPGLISKVKRWLGGSSSTLSGPAPFTLECVCGRPVEGIRQATHQVVFCPRCGARLFVLPRSPLPAVSLPPSKKRQKPASPGPIWRRWPVTLGAGLALVAMAGLVWWFAFRDTGSEQVSDVGVRDLGSSIRQAEKALALGHAATARQALDQALEGEGSLAPAQRRRLERLRRQASLAADLLDMPLEDVVRIAAELPFGEWKAVFRERYHGKGVIFDAEVGRQASGKFSLDYRVFVERKEARVEIGDLVLLRQLHLDQPRRLILGARLAGVERQRDGPWVIRFQPTSGVLLTHLPLFKALCPGLTNDADAALTLKRQAAWLEELP